MTCPPDLEQHECAAVTCVLLKIMMMPLPTNGVRLLSEMCLVHWLVLIVASCVGHVGCWLLVWLAGWHGFGCWQHHQVLSPS